MRRAVIFVVLLLASLTFLMLQIISIRGLDNQSIFHLVPGELHNSGGHVGVPRVTRENSWTSRLGKAVGLGNFVAKKDSPAWKNLKYISDISTGFNIKLFIVDTEILQDLVIDHLTGNSSSKYIWYFAPQFSSGCRHICGKKRIVLGAFGVKWSDIRDNFELTLIRKGFQSNCCKDQDPRLITVDKTLYSTIDLHCSFTSEGSNIDIVIFHQRLDFLWHGSTSESRKTDKDFGKFAGAFDMFTLTKSTVDGIDIFIPKSPSNFVTEMKASKFIECDVKQAQAFYSKYGEARSAEAEEFMTQAIKVLNTAKNALEGLGIRFWLSSGTCLGWYRQCGIIPHSKDVDIGIWIKEYNIRLVDRFKRHGLILSHKFGRVEDSLELSFRTSEGKVKLDIFFFYEEKDYMWNGGTQARTGKKFKYIFPKFTLCWTDFMSMKIRVPCETRAYIEANYGKMWNVPIRSWDWKASPSNVQPNGEWDKKDWGEVIQMM